MDRILASFRESFTRLSFNDYASLLTQTGIGILATRFSWPYISTIASIYTAPFYPLAFIALPSILMAKCLRRIDYPYPPWSAVLFQYLCLISYLNTTICLLQFSIPYNLLQYAWPDIPSVPHSISTGAILTLNAIQSEVAYFDQLCAKFTFTDPTPAKIQQIAQSASILLLSAQYNDILAVAL